MEQGELTPGISHSTGRGKMRSLWGSHGAFLAPQFPGTSVTAPASPVRPEQPESQQGSRGWKLVGLSRTCWVTLTGWCSAACDTRGQDWCQTRGWSQGPALGTAFQHFQVKLPLHFQEGNSMSWAMLSHSHQNPSLTLIAHTLSGPSSGDQTQG